MTNYPTLLIVGYYAKGKHIKYFIHHFEISWILVSLKRTGAYLRLISPSG